MSAADERTVDELAFDLDEERFGPQDDEPAAAEQVFVSLGGHTVYADGVCTRPSCGARHPYVVPAVTR